MILEWINKEFLNQGMNAMDFFSYFWSHENKFNTITSIYFWF